MNLTTFKTIKIGIWILGCLSFIAFAQPVKTPCHKQTYFLNSGMHEGIGSEARLAYSQVVEIPDAQWLRLYFGSSELGQNSYISIASLEDGGQQRLDGFRLKQWENASAFFNGNAIRVELFVAPEDREIFFEIQEILSGEAVDKGKPRPPGGIESQCGDSDDRIPSNNPAVGRTAWINASGDTIAWCTGWIVSNGAYLTAGHCSGDGELELLEFNVPLSDPDGTPNFADPEDQYPVIAGSIVFMDGGVGNDWGVFNCGPNGNTGMLPVHKQNAFYRMTHDSNPTDIRITGYGVDTESANQTQQTHVGASLGETVQGASNVFWEYLVDTEGGNSGSPIIVNGINLTLGIHTHGGCDPPNMGNHGTGFENDDLENAIQNFPGTNVVYADNGHPIGDEDGGVFRPYDTIDEAVNAVSTGAMVSIVRGSYNENITISKALTLSAPVGTVTIGTMPFDTPELKAASNSNIKNVNE